METTCAPEDRIIGIPGSGSCSDTPVSNTVLVDSPNNSGLSESQKYSELTQAQVLTDDKILDTTGYMPAQYKACQRISSRCRAQKALFLLHAVGSGKTITSLCMAFNFHPSIQTTVITIRGLQTAFRDEYNNLVAVYKKEPVEKKFKEMRCVFYDEFASKLLSLSVMSEEERAKAVAAQYTNRVLLFDEAHKLLGILAKDRSGASERMIKYIFAKAYKVIIMTATPLQRDWSDFGKLLKLVGQANDPAILGQIRVWDERLFKKSFWFPDDVDKSWRLKDAVYTAVLIRLTEWVDVVAKHKFTLEAAINAPESLKTGQGYFLQYMPNINDTVASALKVVGAGLGVRYFASMSTNGKIAAGALLLLAASGLAVGGLAATGIGSALAAATAVVGTVSTYALTAANYALVTKMTLVSAKGLIDTFSVTVEPLAIEEVSSLFFPFISFNDYKSTEADHINFLKKVNPSTLTEEQKNKLTEYENILARFPSLNIMNVNVKLEWDQTSILLSNLNKGYVPTTAELYYVGRIDAEYTKGVDKQININFIDSTQVNLDDIPMLQTSLRSAGNYSLDCREYLPVIWNTEDPLFKNCYYAQKLTEESLYQFHGRNVYEELKPRINQHNETKAKKYDEIAKRGVKIPMSIFSNPKFEKAYDIICEARKQFIYLPVVYSNFLDQGLKRFSAFLTSKHLPHLILGPSVLSENPDFIQKTQEPYLRWLKNPEFSDTIDERFRGLNEYATYKQPCCILLDPSLQEGLSLVVNEVMICLEPMTGYGNQEQVYGRVVRSYSNFNKILTIRNYEVYNHIEKSEIVYSPNGSDILCRKRKETDHSPSKTKILQIQNIQTVYDRKKTWIRKNYFKNIKNDTTYLKNFKEYGSQTSLFKSKLFNTTSSYTPVIYKEDDLNSRPQKYMFQLLSQMYDGPKDEDILTLPVRSLLVVFLENKNGDLGPFKTLVDKIPLSLATPFYKQEELLDMEMPKELKQPWLHFLHSLVPRSSWALDWNVLVPYSMFYAAAQDKELVMDPSIANPQKWSEIAGLGVVDTRSPTADQYWFSKNKLQEIEFNKLREEFNKTDDSNIENLYPTKKLIESKGRKDHFEHDRFMCSSSDKFYPKSRHNTTYKCSIKGRMTSVEDACDKIGPAAATVGGRRKTRKVRARTNEYNGLSQQQAQLLMTRPVEKDEQLERLKNIYEEPAQCVSLCNEFDKVAFLVDFLKGFVGKSDAEAISMLNGMRNTSQEEENLGLLG